MHDRRKNLAGSLGTLKRPALWWLAWVLQAEIVRLLVESEEFGITAPGHDRLQRVIRILLGHVIFKLVPKAHDGRGGCQELSGTQWLNKPEFCPTLSVVARSDVTLPGIVNKSVVIAEIKHSKA